MRNGLLKKVRKEGKKLNFLSLIKTNMNKMSNDILNSHWSLDHLSFHWEAYKSQMHLHHYKLHCTLYIVHCTLSWILLFILNAQSLIWSPCGQSFFLSINSTQTKLSQTDVSNLGHDNPFTFCCLLFSFFFNFLL